MLTLFHGPQIFIPIMLIILVLGCQISETPLTNVLFNSFNTVTFSLSLESEDNFLKPKMSQFLSKSLMQNFGPLFLSLRLRLQVFAKFFKCITCSLSSPTPLPPSLCVSFLALYISPSLYSEVGLLTLMLSLVGLSVTFSFRNVSERERKRD